MYAIFFTFIENMAFIIAFKFLGLKLQESFLKKQPRLFLQNSNWLVPLFYGFISIWIMMFVPVQLEEIHLDLRSVPIFLISYAAGWKMGMLSAVFPALYRFYLGGPGVFHGVTQGIVLPLLIGSLFYYFQQKESYTPRRTVIRKKYLLPAVCLFEASQALLILWFSPVAGGIIFMMVLFSTIAIVGMAMMINDDSKMNLQTKELLFLSHYDSLTHIPNRRFFKEKSEELLKEKKQIAIAMFDVDFFKVYNDTHGHQAGDKVLREVAQLLKENMREQDIIGRYGGEEFIICFHEPGSMENIKEIAERFRWIVEQYPFPGQEQQPNHSVTISLGLSRPSKVKPLDELIEEADQALYQAKEKGRNRMETFSQ